MKLIRTSIWFFLSKQVYRACWIRMTSNQPCVCTIFWLAGTQIWPLEQNWLSCCMPIPSQLPVTSHEHPIRVTHDLWRSMSVAKDLWQVWRLWQSISLQPRGVTKEFLDGSHFSHQLPFVTYQEWSVFQRSNRFVTALEQVFCVVHGMSQKLKTGQT